MREESKEQWEPHKESRSIISVARSTTRNMRRRSSLHGQKWCSFKSPHLTSLLLPKVPKLCGSSSRYLDLTAWGDQENCLALLVLAFLFFGHFCCRLLKCLIFVFFLTDINIKESSKARAPAYTFGNRLEMIFGVKIQMRHFSIWGQFFCDG